MARMRRRYPGPCQGCGIIPRGPGGRAVLLLNATPIGVAPPPDRSASALHPSLWSQGRTGCVVELSPTERLNELFHELACRPARHRDPVLERPHGCGHAEGGRAAEGR